MIDFEGVKNRVKLIDLVGGLKKVASTGGGEYAGPCPFCGGSDRFRVQPAQNIWFCRQCTGDQWHDATDFIAKRDNTSLLEAAKSLGADRDFRFIDKVSFTPPYKTMTQDTQKTSHKTGYSPPGQKWQAKADQAVQTCKECLYSVTGAKALDYLHRRGLSDETIRRFELGYSPGAEIAGLWVTHGVTIPARINGVIWYVKIRTNKKDPKYTLVKGSRPAAIYNGDDLIKTKMCLVVEGEFNAMIAWQQTRDIDDVLSIGSLGAAGNRPNLAAWGPYFLNKSLILALYDDDQAGDDGAVRLYQALGYRVKFAAIPSGQGDLNDWYLDGGDVLHWIATEIDFHKDSVLEVTA